MPWRITSQHSVGMTEADGEVRRKARGQQKFCIGGTMSHPCSSPRGGVEEGVRLLPLHQLKFQDRYTGFPLMHFKAPFGLWISQDIMK